MLMYLPGKWKSFAQIRLHFFEDQRYVALLCLKIELVLNTKFQFCTLVWNLKTVL